MVSASDGSAFTGAVTVYVTGDAGVQAVGSVGAGACTHKGNGYHTYAPAQGETNYDLAAFTFIGSGAVPVTVQNATAVALAPTGLDSISTTAPAGVAANFREMLVQVWRRFFKRAVKDTTTLKTYADNGTSVLTTQAYTSTGGTDDVGAAT